MSFLSSYLRSYLRSYLNSYLRNYQRSYLGSCMGSSSLAGGPPPTDSEEPRGEDPSHKPVTAAGGQELPWWILGTFKKTWKESLLLQIESI